jgi:hypothetical protein
MKNVDFRLAEIVKVTQTLKIIDVGLIRMIMKVDP